MTLEEARAAALNRKKLAAEDEAETAPANQSDATAPAPRPARGPTAGSIAARHAMEASGKAAAAQGAGTPGPSPANTAMPDVSEAARKALEGAALQEAPAPVPQQAQELVAGLEQGGDPLEAVQQWESIPPEEYIAGLDPAVGRIIRLKMAQFPGTTAQQLNQELTRELEALPPEAQAEEIQRLDQMIGARPGPGEYDSHFPAISRRAEGERLRSTLMNKARGILSGQVGADRRAALLQQTEGGQ